MSSRAAVGPSTYRTASRGSIPTGRSSGSPPSTSTTLSTRSGCRSANTAETNAPIECPTTTARSTPLASRTAARSSECCARPVRRLDAVLRPRPRRSGAISRASVSRATHAHARCEAVTPCTSSHGAPSASGCHSPTRRVPSCTTTRCVRSVRGAASSRSGAEAAPCARLTPVPAEGMFLALTGARGVRSTADSRASPSSACGSPFTAPSVPEGVITSSSRSPRASARGAGADGAIAPSCSPAPDGSAREAGSDERSSGPVRRRRGRHDDGPVVFAGAGWEREGGRCRRAIARARSPATGPSR